MPPSISSSDALVIWMLRMAMKAPIMPASTATHAVRLALSPEASAVAGSVRGARGSEMCAVVAMCAAPSSRANQIAALLLADEGDLGGLVAGLGVDRRDHGHARAQHVGARL